MRVSRRHDESDRIAIFFDMSNLYFAARDMGIRIDYARLLDFLTSGRRLHRAYAYLGYNPEDESSHSFITWLKRNGFRVKTKALRRFEDGSTKANLDMELAIDLLTQAPHIDVAIVVSGDGDFVNLVDAAQNAGLRVEVAATPRQAATDLMDIADQFIDLEANVAQFARADLPPRQAYARPEGVVPAARTPPTSGYAPRPYGASVRGYQNAGTTFGPHSGEEERIGNHDESNTPDEENHDALLVPPAGK
ncbi:MAG: NYN domain-containing protein [Thermomicrobia bacterium]|nr:NYN domain-containing protein [Thermomicrobia bacterium]MCA1722982.1 NYN domain-containing protein [Thermomicrobia bacterium]